MGQRPGSTASILQDKPVSSCAVPASKAGASEGRGKGWGVWLFGLYDGPEAAVGLSFFRATGISLAYDI